MACFSPVINNRTQHTEVLLQPALPCPALPCPALPCPALPCPALPCPALPCPALPCPALPRLGNTGSGPLGQYTISTAQQCRLVCCDHHKVGTRHDQRRWVQQAQMHCSAIPSFAQTPPPAWQTTPLGSSGLQIRPRDVGLSMMDEHSGPHVLCCGHMLHESCLANHR